MKKKLTTVTAITTLLAFGLAYTMARKGVRWLSKEASEIPAAAEEQWTTRAPFEERATRRHRQPPPSGKQLLHGLGDETLAVAQEQWAEETGFGDFDYSVSVVARLDKGVDTLMGVGCAGGETLRGLISQSEPMRSSYSEEIEVRLDDEATEAISVEIDERFFVGWQRRVQQEMSYAPTTAKCALWE